MISPRASHIRNQSELQNMLAAYQQSLGHECMSWRLQISLGKKLKFPIRDPLVGNWCFFITCVSTAWFLWICLPTKSHPCKVGKSLSSTGLPCPAIKLVTVVNVVSCPVLGPSASPLSRSLYCNTASDILYNKAKGISAELLELNFGQIQCFFCCWQIQFFCGKYSGILDK